MGSKKSKPKRLSKYASDTASSIPRSHTGETEVKEFRQVHEDRVSCVAVYKPGVCVSGSTDTVRECCCYTNSTTISLTLFKCFKEWQSNIILIYLRLF